MQQTSSQKRRRQHVRASHSQARAREGRPDMDEKEDLRR